MTRWEGVEVRVAASPLVRLAGLALLRRDRAGGGLLIPRCRSVHTFGMRFRLDLVFLDAEGSVLMRRYAVPPSRFVGSRRAQVVIELPTPEGGFEPPGRRGAADGVRSFTHFCD